MSELRYVPCMLYPVPESLDRQHVERVLGPEGSACSAVTTTFRCPSHPFYPFPIVGSSRYSHGIWALGRVTFGRTVQNRPTKVKVTGVI